MTSKIKIVGITVSLSFLAFISLAIFIRAISILFDDWFSNNALIITIVSGVIVLILILTGAISLGALTSKAKGFFG
jgi:hypothetical protein